MTPTPPTAKPAPEDFDIDGFADLTTAQLTLKHPTTGAPTALWVQLAGPEHPLRKKIHFDRARRIRANYQRDGKAAITDPLEDIDEETDYLVAITLGWHLVQKGADLAWSASAARALYTDPQRQWLRAQVRKASDEAERFIAASAKA